jgi:hypothetical protein
MGMSGIKWKFGLLVVAMFCSIRFSCSAATINAANATYAAVSNAVASASPGDVVMIPPGTNTWSQQLVLSGVSLIGSGTNSTVIIDELSRGNSGTPVIAISAISQLTEVSQLQIAAGTTNTQYNYNGEISVSGDLPACWRIDHCFFNGPYGKAVISYGNPFAVVDHCEFVMRAEGVLNYGDGYGDANWSSPPSYGSSNMVYVEDCLFTNIVGYPAGVIDGDAGGRIVFRNNVVLNDFWANHGTESGQRYRSMRLFEIYNNSFTDNNNFTWAIQLRGGTGVIYSNTAAGYNFLCGMFYYRVGEAFQPWGGMTGYNPWDSNDPAMYLSGTSSGANNSTTLTVNNANWTANQWVGYTVNDTNTGGFSIIVGNTANTISVMASKDNGPMTFNNGDHFTIYRAEIGLDQVGRGSGDLISGDGPPWGSIEDVVTGIIGWPHEISEPLYCWGNTLNGSVGTAETDYPNIQSGRDFINGTAKPGYTAYTYPHPLTLGTNAYVAPPSGPTNNEPTNGLAPPSGLHVIP